MKMRQLRGTSLGGTDLRVTAAILVRIIAGAIIFLLPATILILLREFTLPPLSVQVGPNAVNKRTLTRAT